MEEARRYLLLVLGRDAIRHARRMIIGDCRASGRDLLARAVAIGTLILTARSRVLHRLFAVVMAVSVAAGREGAAQTPAIPERLSSEEGCLEGRILDYLERHGDDGRIDSDALLYRTVQLKRE